MTTLEPTRETVTVAEAATRLGISINHARAAIKTGEIPSLRIGQRVLVPRRALDQMLLAGTG
jgi:excisionase family DNA binding protein